MSRLSLRLPGPGGELTTYRLRGEPVAGPAGRGEPRSRRAYAAAHVVRDPFQDDGPHERPAVDWDATLAFRRHLWDLGLGVADALDTAQRGMGLDWPATRELIERSAREAPRIGGRLVCGVNTDQHDPASLPTLADVRAAYAEQLELVESCGARAVLMCTRALPRVAQHPDDYLAVYGELLAQVDRPVVLHWLGEMFDPRLRGYWGHTDPWKALEVVVSLVEAHADRVEGIKVSLLDADVEVALRRRLPEGVRCYTGDDFNFPQLVEGDEHGHSDALLGIFDGIAPVAAAALAALDEDDVGRYRQLLAPTVPLARHVFAAPTFHYKTGLVFLAYCNGHQDHFQMVDGRESARSIVHLARLFTLADAAGVLADPERAVARFAPLLQVAGVAQ